MLFSSLLATALGLFTLVFSVVLVPGAGWFGGSTSAIIFLMVLLWVIYSMVWLLFILFVRAIVHMFKTLTNPVPRDDRQR